MIATRRGFLAALASLPFLRILVPEAAAAGPTITCNVLSATGPMLTEAGLARLLTRTYNREEYFRPLEQETSNFFDAIDEGEA